MMAINEATAAWFGGAAQAAEAPRAKAIEAHPIPEPRGSEARVGGYEDAPAMKLVATNCACCGRPLVDAVSVEAGMGPVCREKHGYEVAQGTARWAEVMMLLDSLVAVAEVNPSVEPRVAANKLVHRIAARPGDAGVPQLIAAVHALGFQQLAASIAEHLVARVEVREHDLATLIVRAPYSEDFNAHMRGIPGARWHRALKARLVPTQHRAALWNAIRASFGPGTIVDGSRGMKVL